MEILGGFLWFPKCILGGVLGWVPWKSDSPVCLQEDYQKGSWDQLREAEMAKGVVGLPQGPQPMPRGL